MNQSNRMLSDTRTGWIVDDTTEFHDFIDFDALPPLAAPSSGVRPVSHNVACPPQDTATLRSQASKSMISFDCQTIGPASATQSVAEAKSPKNSIATTRSSEPKRDTAAPTAPVGDLMQGLSSITTTNPNAAPSTTENPTNSQAAAPKSGINASAPRAGDLMQGLSSITTTNPNAIPSTAEKPSNSQNESPKTGVQALTSRVGDLMQGLSSIATTNSNAAPSTAENRIDTQAEASKTVDSPKTGVHTLTSRVGDLMQGLTSIATTNPSAAASTTENPINSQPDSRKSDVGTLTPRVDNSMQSLSSVSTSKPNTAPSAAEDPLNYQADSRKIEVGTSTPRTGNLVQSSPSIATTNPRRFDDRANTKAGAQPRTDASLAGRGSAASPPPAKQAQYEAPPARRLGYDASTQSVGSANDFASEPIRSAQTAQGLAPTAEAGSSLDRPKIIFRPVVPAVDRHGNALFRPDVQLADSQLMSGNLPSLRIAHHEPEGLPTPPQARPTPEPRGESTHVIESDGIPQGTEYDGEQGWPMQGFDQTMAGDSCSSNGCDDEWSDVDPIRSCWYTFLANLNGPRACPSGIGPERVMNAPFFIDTTQPLNNCRVRFDAGNNWEFPDRAEYFWAKTPGQGVNKPPLNVGEPSVDYQDIRFYIEKGSKRFSVGTELPIRSVDPELYDNFTGFADMNLTTKALLLDGRCWQLSQIFRTYFPTGAVHHGTGTGHFSLEPGVAARYKWSDITYFHGDLKYWFPIAGDPTQSGQILNAGIGISHVLIDTDRFAVIPTLELDSSTVLDGQQTPPFSPTPEQIDTIGIVNLHPGVRFVCDKGCDCGTREIGITGGVAVTEDHWYQSMIRLEFRWTH